MITVEFYENLYRGLSDYEKEFLPKIFQAVRQ